MHQDGKQRVRWALVLAGLLGLARPEGAASAAGVVLIDQAAALAGGVTSGDTAGFPVTISRAGSYRLVSNLTVPDAATTAIEILTGDVTLDLNGFRIKGPTVCDENTGSCAPLGPGVGVDAGKRKNITVLNGTVRGMGNDGVLLGDYSRIAQVTGLSNGGDGLEVGQGSAVLDTLASNNGRNGIVDGFSSTVSGNTAIRNHFAGIQAGGGCTVTHNTVNVNGSAGIFANTSLVLGNMASFNTFDGIVAAGATGSLVLQNLALANGGFGLDLGSTSGYADNVLNANNDSDLNPQVSGGIEIGSNMCGGNTSCP